MASGPAMEECLQMACLGRPFSLGSFYDSRTDCLIPALSFWREKRIKPAQILEKPWSDCSVEMSETIHAKLDSLKVDVQAKLSLMFGLIEVSGSAQYANDKRNSSNVNRCTLKYQCSSRVESMTMEQLTTKIDFKDPVFAKSQPTHIVTAILYGANVFIVLDYHKQDDSESSHLDGNFSGCVDAFLAKAEADVSVSSSKSDRDFVNNLSVKLHGDCKLDVNPTTSAEALDLYKRLPKIMSEDEHVPVQVWLYPLNKLYSEAAKLECSISMDLVNNLCTRMGNLDEYIVRANQIMENAFNNFKSLSSKVNKFKESLISFKTSMQQKMQKILPKIRGGALGEDSLCEILSEWNESPFCEGLIEEWLNDHKALSSILMQYLSSFKAGKVKNVLEPGEMTGAMLHCRYMAVFLFNFDETDALLKEMKHYAKDLMTKNTPTANCNVQYFPRHYSMLETVSATKNFISFAKANESAKSIKFAYGQDSTTEGIKVRVQIYEDGQILNHDFHAPKFGTTKMTAKNGEIFIDWSLLSGKEEILYYEVCVSDDNWENTDNSRVSRDKTRLSLDPERMVDGKTRVKVKAMCQYGTSVMSESVIYTKSPR